MTFRLSLTLEPELRISGDSGEESGWILRLSSLQGWKTAMLGARVFFVLYFALKVCNAAEEETLHLDELYDEFFEVFNLKYSPIPFLEASSSLTRSSVRTYTVHR